MKRIGLLFAALCCMVWVNAQEPDTPKRIEYESGRFMYFILDDAIHTATVTWCQDESYNSTEDYTGDILVPVTVTYNNETYSVTSIGTAAFQGCTGLTSISLQEGITSIGFDAFKDCSGLKNAVVIPSTVKTIGERAFYNCTKLLSVTIKGGSIGDDAFWNCTGITSISLQEGVTGIGTYAFHNCFGINKGVVIPSTVTNIGNNAFNECKSLPSVTVEGGSIGDNAFSGCTSLTSISLEEGVTNIGNYIFDGCYNIEGDLIIPSTVTSVGHHAFYHLEKLSSVTVWGGSLGDYAFSGCTGLTLMSLQEGVANIGNFVFENCSAAKGELVIPSTVTSIGNFAFSGCTGITSVSLQEGVTTIGNSAFLNCSGVKRDLVIPSTVRTIGDAAFSGCTGLTSISIPEGVMTIGDSAFGGCSGVEENLNIPSTVTSIGQYAFAGCAGLPSMYVFASTPPALGDCAFDEVDKGIPVYVPNDVVYAGWGGFTNIRLIDFFKLGDVTYMLNEEGRIERVKFTDKDAYLSYRDFVVGDLFYTRDFDQSKGKWQCWYMPFDVDLSILNDKKMDVAEIAGILLDEDENTVVAFKKMKGEERVLKANTPYVVRLRSDAPVAFVEFVFSNKKVKISEENSFSIQSAYDTFTFKGNYTPKHSDGCYTLNTQGVFQKMADGVDLYPMRFRLTIDTRNDGPYYNPTTNAKEFVEMTVLGDDGTTGITSCENEDADENRRAGAEGEGVIYDLVGCKVTSIRKGQIYIMNGKKYMAE